MLLFSNISGIIAKQNYQLSLILPNLASKLLSNATALNGHKLGLLECFTT